VQQEIRERVESGKYADADAVMEAALEQLEDHEKFLHVRDILTRAHERLAETGGEVYTPELGQRIWESAKRRAAAGEKPNPDVCP
jgi:Arc/MetJ-type ribon-helix-helix transcriptional regulator